MNSGTDQQQVTSTLEDEMEWEVRPHGFMFALVLAVPCWAIIGLVVWWVCR